MVEAGVGCRDEFDDAHGSCGTWVTIVSGDNDGRWADAGRNVAAWQS
jgi:hypothetical protein